MFAIAHICLRSMSAEIAAKLNITWRDSREHTLFLLEEEFHINMKHYKSEHKPRYFGWDIVLFFIGSC